MGESWESNSTRRDRYERQATPPTIGPCPYVGLSERVSHVGNVRQDLVVLAPLIFFLMHPFFDGLSNKMQQRGQLIAGVGFDSLCACESGRHAVNDGVQTVEKIEITHTLRSDLLDSRTTPPCPPASRSYVSPQEGCARDEREGRCCTIERTRPPRKGRSGGRSKKRPRLPVNH
jgi:hypothetical protein